MSHHLEQVAAEVRRRLQTLLARGLADPRVRGLVSLTEVRVAPDLSEAYVKVSVLPEEQGPLTLKGLRHAAGHLQTEIGRGVRMRRVPRLVFELDDTMKRQAELESAIADGAAGDVMDVETEAVAERPRNEEIQG